MELFYAFKDFKSIKQDRSKLCWAACIEMILTSIDTHHLEDEFQINAAKKYKDKYFIYRVVNAKVNPKISIKIKNPWDFHKKGTLDIAPINYKLTFQDD